MTTTADTPHELACKDVAYWLHLRAFCAAIDQTSGLMSTGVVAEAAAAVIEGRVDELVEAWAGTATWDRLQREIATLEARHAQRLRDRARVAVAPQARRSAA